MIPADKLEAVLWDKYQDANKRGAVSRAKAYMEIIQLVTDTFHVQGRDYKQTVFEEKRTGSGGR